MKDHALNQAKHGEYASKKYTNRLAKETSPYLLLHAHNPVNWYPWGPEALAEAKKKNKLIFLSIGYSSCYWCHVMERESFTNEKIAAYMNEHFVSIKVDREERPDVDDIYMTSLHVLGGRGGWPLSMFLTPDAKPITGGTYYPPEDKYGRPGFLTVLNKIQGAWEKQREELLKQADTVANLVQKNLQQRPPATPIKLNNALVDAVLVGLERSYDPRFGGFSPPGSPKFPSPPNLVYLLERIRRNDDKKARAMLMHTLEMIARGGIRDHLGGGFHRYSTDRFWRIPHFEKMLYDNGQLASVYAEAYQLTKKPEFKQVAEEIFEFVLREMLDSGGGFYSALDAETDGKEGDFNIWQREEIQKLLDEKEFALLSEAFDLGPAPNFRDPHSGDQAYVLFQPIPLAEVASKQKISTEQLEKRLAPIRKKLFDARAKRKRPLTDTKILTAWNGLMIRGLADSGRCLENQKHLDAAIQAADFALKNLRTEKGRLLRTSTAGKVKLNAYLDDYAYLIDGLIALHKATKDPRWLNQADQLTQKQIELFWDEKGGGFFFTSSDHEALIARGKRFRDGVQPSGNSIAAGNLVYLARALDKPEYLDRAQKTIEASSLMLQRAPSAMPQMATALAALLDAKAKKEK